MEVQFDINDKIYIYLDRRRRRRKFVITTFLRAIGYETNRDILGGVYEVKSFTVAQLLKQPDLSKYYTVDDVIDEKMMWSFSKNLHSSLNPPSNRFSRPISRNSN